MAFVDGCRVPGDASGVTEVQFSPAARITAATPYALVLEPHQGNLPGTAATWRPGKGKAVPGDTYRARSGGEVAVWERAKDAARPQAYGTYVSMQPPDEFTRSATTLTVTAKPDALKRYRTTTLTAHVAVRDDSAKVPSGTVTSGSRVRRATR
jgi:hypothetical protein